MAGLLDFLDTPGASMGLGLLAAGGPTTDPNAAGFGASLARGVQMGRAMQDQQTDKQLKQAYLQGQIDAQKRAEREYQDKKAAQSTYLGLLGFAPGAAGADPGAGASPAAGSPASATPGGTAPGAPGGSGQFSVGNLSPEQVLAMQAYAKQSGMPDPTEVWKLARPDMQVANGYAYDKNRVQAGFLPSLNVSQNGQASMVLPGPNGLPVVMAPQGAVDTARAYADVGNMSRAATTPGRPTILPGGRMGGQSQAAEMGMSGGPAIGMGAGYANEPAMRETAALQTDAASAEAARREIAAMQRDLATPGKVQDPQSRAALQAEIQRLGGQLSANPAASKPAIGPGAAVVPGGGVEFSPEEKAAQAAQQAGAVKQAEADVQPTAGRVQKYTAASDAIGLIDKALSSPGLSKATGLGALNPLNKVPGTQGYDFNVLRDQLKGTAFLSAYGELKGGGAITEVEGKKAEDAIARLNTAQSEPAFRQALNDYRVILERGMRRAEGVLPAGSVDDLPDRSKPAQIPGAPAVGTVKGGYRFKGGDPSKPTSWEKM